MRIVAVAVVLSLCASIAAAQFTGPSATGRAITVDQVRQTRLGSYVTVTGNIVAHQRQNFFTFRDKTGEIRVEIENSVFQNQKVSPETKVRLLAEIDQSLTGRYLWVKSLQIVE